MRVVFLGTGTSQGVPVIGCRCGICRSADPRDHRLRSSVLIEEAGTSLVIDCGPDFRQQMLREGIGRLDAVLITHGHKDHTGGLDDIRSFNFLQRKPMAVYCGGEVLKGIRSEFSYAFADDPYPGVPQFDLHEIGTEVFEVGPFQVQPITVQHGSLPVLGFRFGSFTYITDASYIPPASMELARGSEVIVLNALRTREHYSHFNLSQALEVLEALEPRKAYLTHIGHQMGRYEDIRPLLPSWADLAWDGLELSL